MSNNLRPLWYCLSPECQKRLQERWKRLRAPDKPVQVESIEEIAKLMEEAGPDYHEVS